MTILVHYSKIVAKFIQYTLSKEDSKPKLETTKCTITLGTEWRTRAQIIQQNTNVVLFFETQVYKQCCVWNSGSLEDVIINF